MFKLIHLNEKSRMTDRGYAECSSWDTGTGGGPGEKPSIFGHSGQSLPKSQRQTTWSRRVLVAGGIPCWKTGIEKYIAIVMSRVLLHQSAEGPVSCRTENGKKPTSAKETKDAQQKFRSFHYFYDAVVSPYNSLSGRSFRSVYLSLTSSMQLNPAHQTSTNYFKLCDKNQPNFYLLNGTQVKSST